MKNHFIQFLWLIILFTTACSKPKPTSCEPTVQNYYLTGGDKAKIPYTGSDTLVFISNTNDTVTAIGSGKILGFEITDNHSAPDCPRYTDENIYENYTCNFLDKNKNPFISITLTSNSFRTNNNSLVDVTMIFNNLYFYLLAYDISHMGSWNYISSITFNGKQYKDVSCAYKDDADHNSKLYYNQQYGIIRVELNNQQIVWTLK